MGFNWLFGASNQRSREIDAQIRALQQEIRTGSERARAASDDIKKLWAQSQEDAAEIERLKSTIAKLEKQLEWVSEETLKTGTALFERVEALRKS